MEWQEIDQQLLQLNEQTGFLEKQKLREQLVFFVNHLLLNDFNRLVQFLYRIDINEEKLKALLRDNPQTDAAELIADLVIERQTEKNVSKSTFKTDNDSISEDEIW